MARGRPEREEIMNHMLVIELGLVPYGAAWELQRRIVSARKAGAISDALLLCEHPHVITLGRNGDRAHLRVSQQQLRDGHVEFFESDRGGDITYHGPGQLVAYPILDLREIRRDVAWYLRSLEEAMIRTSADLGVRARRVAGRTGVWVDVSPAAGDAASTEEEKLGAIGVHLSRWVTSHGLAYNISTDLRYFDWIVPCGIAEKRATSLGKLLGRDVAWEEVAPRIVAHLGHELDRATQPASAEGLAAILRAHEKQAVAAAV